MFTCHINIRKISRKIKKAVDLALGAALNIILNKKTHMKWRAL